MADQQQDDDHNRTENVTFRQEVDEMERDGALNVWPYRVRKDLSVSQRRLQNARAYVAGKDNMSTKRKAEEDLNERVNSSSISSNVKFLPAAKAELTEAQKIALEIVQKELEAVNKDTAKALAEMSRRSDELVSAQEELRRFAARTRRAQEKMRRQPPVKPPPQALFQASEKVAKKRYAKLEEDRRKASEELERKAKEAADKRRAREERRMEKAEAYSKQQAEELEATRPDREADSKKIADEERRVAAMKTLALDEAASASRARRVLVECPGCGLVMELMKLPRHQKEECENRKVPCKNFEFGCACMVRVRDRKRHEDASDLTRPRSCLWFGGPSALNRIALDEEDIKPPWTAEYWVLRPSLSVAAIGLVTKALAMRYEFRALYATMAETKFRVDSLEKSLVSNISTSKKVSTRKGTDDVSKQSAAEDQAYISSLLLAANDEYRKFAVRVAALRAGYVDMLAAAGRRLAEADNELEDFEILARKSHDGFSTRKDLEAAIEPLLWQYNPRLHQTNETVHDEKKESLDNDEMEEEDDINLLESEENAEVAESGGKDEEANDDEEEDEEEEEEDVKRMTLPRDWIIHCKTPRDLLSAIKSRVGEERKGFENMIKEMTASQGTKKKKKKITGKSKKKEKPMSDRAKRKAKRKAKQAAKREEKRDEQSLGEGLPFAEQVSRAVLGRQGRDTIASCETWRMQLEVGDRDEIGISIPDLGEFTFTDAPAAGSTGHGNSPPAVVPRRKWCHVCFVATAKNKLVVYLNGHLVKRVPKDKGGSALSSGSTVTSNDATSKNSKNSGHPEKKGHNSDTGIDLKQLQVSVGELRVSELRAKTPGSSQGHRGGGDGTSLNTNSMLTKDSNASAVALAGSVWLGLPMRDIGEATGPGVNHNISISGPTCYHGAIQEVRYWSSARSAGEIRGSMHTLLSDDAPKSQGLAGWWTMEEGKGNYAMDVTEARFRSRLIGLIGKGMKWVESEVVAAGQEPPTPAWRERSVCAVELRRVRLAVKGRKLLVPVPCTAGCGESVVKKNMKFHLIYHCRNREVSCWLCGRSNLRYSELPKHLKSGCPAKAQVAALAAVNEANLAPTPCILCNELVVKRNLGKHQREQCPERLVSCRYDCGLRIVAHRLRRHEEEWCDAPKVVELRGLAVKSRKLRHYDRTWCLAETDDGVTKKRRRHENEEDDEDEEDDGVDEEEDDDEEGEDGNGSGGGGGDDETKTPREYVSVRRDPFTLAKMGIDPNDPEDRANLYDTDRMEQ